MSCTPSGGYGCRLRRSSDSSVRGTSCSGPLSEVKAAILKCVTNMAGLTRDVERVLRAVAQAHRETGVPITTHAHAGLRRGLDQQRIFAEEGVDPVRVIIGHSGDTDDYAYLEELIDAGSYLGMDRFGLNAVPFDKRVEIVAEMSVSRAHSIPRNAASFL